MLTSSAWLPRILPPYFLHHERNKPQRIFFFLEPVVERSVSCWHNRSLRAVCSTT